MNAGSILSGADFERYVQDILERQGIPAQDTPASHDYGADLLVRMDGHTVAVQCKYYSKAVGVRAVQEVIGALPFYRADYGAVVTNSVFTQQAANLARANRVLLVPGDSVASLPLLLRGFLGDTMFLEPAPAPSAKERDWVMNDLVVRYGVSQQKILRDFLGDGLPYYKVGREYRFEPEEVEQWEIEKRRVSYGHSGYIVLPAYAAFAQSLRKKYARARKRRDRRKARRLRALAQEHGVPLPSSRFLPAVVALLAFAAALCALYFIISRS